ncbi:MAG: RNA polymerase sigma factor [Lentisphaeria bacterium]|nr:RNA polymerase sigma factor [Lentisphaeria bacterium]
MRMTSGTDDGTLAVNNLNPELNAPPGGFDLVKVVREYETPLLRYVARLIGSRYDEARDVVQDVFLKLHKHMTTPGQADIGNMRGWLYRVAHNLAMDYGRGRKRRQTLENTALSDPSVLEKTRGGKLDDARDIEKKEAAQVALRAVDRLPEEQKNVVLLKIIQGFTLKEISGMTGLKIGTVNYRLTQGLRTLAAQLQDRGDQ